MRLPALWLRIFSYLHSSHITFIGLLPRFIFFVKVLFRRRDINHFSRTSFNKFLNLCRPLVGKDLRVRRSIPVLSNFSWSYNFHRRIPPFHLFPASLVSRSRVSNTLGFFPSRVFTLALGYFIRLSPLNGKESSLFVPSFLDLLPCPYGTLPTPLSFGCVLFVHRFILFYEKLKHFLSISFSLYLYYSRNFPLVKGFLKKSLNFF